MENTENPIENIASRDLETIIRPPGCRVLSSSLYPKPPGVVSYC
jgi:hypothetical protein